MAVNSLDSIVSGLSRTVPFQIVNAVAAPATTLFNPHYKPGLGGGMAAPSSGMAGAALTAITGQIPFVNPTGGDETRLTDFFHAQYSSSGQLLAILVDRLWDQSGIVVTTTTAQTINSAAWPARDLNGSTDGEGVYIALEVSGVTTAANTLMTISYTNSAGTSGRTSAAITGSTGLPASAPIGTLVFFPLAAGDTGVRSVQSITLNASLTAGTVHLVAFRPITLMFNLNANPDGILSGLQLGLPKLYDNSVLQVWTRHSGSVSAGFIGYVRLTQG